MDRLNIEQYTLDDFNTVEPYKALELIDDAFLKQSEEARLEEYAIKIGFKRFKKQLAAYRRDLKKAAVSVVVAGGITDFEGKKAPELRLVSWNADETGIWRISRDGTREYACKHPIAPARLLRNIDTGETKVELWFKRGTFGSEITQVVDYDTIANAKNIVSLAKIGVSVDSNTAKSLVAYLSEATDVNYDVLPKVKTVSHLGWNHGGEGFAPYTDDVEFDGNPNFESTFKAIKCVGDLETWFDEIVKCRAYSKTVHILTAASFASCLIEPLGVLPFFVHLWGMDSGTGKTVAQMCAASIWGNPTVGEPFFPTFKGTQVGFELLSGFLRSIPMFIDELQLAKDNKGRVAFNVYELAAGTGKIRGTKSLGLALVPKWNICFITSGETPLVSETDGAGALNRVIEVECKAKNKCIEDGHHTANTLKTNFGFGGKMFVAKLRQEGNIDRAKKLYEKFYMECVADKATEKQAMAAATILTADTLACDWIFDDAPLTAKDMQEFIKTAESVSLSERGYQCLRDWVAENFGHFGAIDGNVERFGEIEGDENGRSIAYIIRSKFNEVCERNKINPKALLSQLKTNELIRIRNDGKGFCIKRRLSGGIPVDCVALYLDPEEQPVEYDIDF